MEKRFFYSADVLLPKKDFEKWSVIACDQYTSQPEYWNETKKIVGENPSALNIVLPEAFLEEDNSKAISKVNETMKNYLENGVFDVYSDTFVYIERKLNNGSLRRGILGLIDLEDYSYLKGSNSLIRATEETVLERIPPRVNIRLEAPLEIPHIMLLIDDEEKSVIEPLSEKTENFEKLYDFSLMQNAGSIKGYKISKNACEQMLDAIENLAQKNDGMLFAVGDGNHSLASAKECYKLGKGSRFALVEVVNIHENSLEFEPIYRVLFGVEPQKVIDDFVKSLGGEYYGFDAQKFTCVFAGETKEISVKPNGKLAVATLQKFLDEYIKNTEIKIDYIHGIEATKALSERKNAIGFIFEGMQKSELFEAVCSDGSLPRKTFSMGTADDKRFYLEARKF
jgi:uncharacterized protein (DUF1015 family)